MAEDLVADLEPISLTELYDQVPEIDGRRMLKARTRAPNTFSIP